MKIEVLGTGCRRCEQLYENTVSAVSELDPAAGIRIDKINDVNYFTKMGVFMPPGLIIDGDVKFAGKVPSVDDLVKLIGEAAAG